MIVDREYAAVGICGIGRRRKLLCAKVFLLWMIARMMVERGSIQRVLYYGGLYGPSHRLSL